MTVSQFDGHERESRDRIAQLPDEKKQAAEHRENEYRNSENYIKYQKMTSAARDRLQGLLPLEQALDLDKSWHTLHYLFTGHIDDADAPGNELLTGQEIGPDWGYGPPRMQSEAETGRFANFLQKQTVAALQARVNYHEMMRVGVYGLPPEGQEPASQIEAEIRQWDVGYRFPLLRDYVSAMAQKNDGLLIWIT